MKTKVKNISRREAIGKAGKYAAVTAAATFLILSPKESQANSPTDLSDPGWSSLDKIHLNQTENKDSNINET